MVYKDCMRPKLRTILLGITVLFTGTIFAESVTGDSASVDTVAVIKTGFISDYKFSIPRKKYTMIGIPFVVHNGDPAKLFQDDLQNRRPGHPRWRVSRWEPAKAKYIRYKEKDLLNRGWNRDCENFAPGLGFWIVQNVAEICTLDIHPDQIISYVSQKKPFSVVIGKPEGGNRGLTQLANPYVYAYDWRTILVTDGNDTVEIDSAAYHNWINGYAYVWDIRKEQYIAVNFHPSANLNYSIGPWEGFWVEQLIQNKNIRIIFLPKGYATGTQGLVKTMDGWAFNISVESVTGDYGDELNIVGINKSAEDDYDYMDAMQFYPMTDKHVQLFFPHLDLFPRWPVQAKRFTYDYRSTDFAGSKAWDFTVAVTNLPETEFSIKWTGLRVIPDNYEFVLKNADTGDEIANLREQTSYSFKSGNSYYEDQHFCLIVSYLLKYESSAEQPETKQHGFVSAFPSPFSEIIYISYLLSASQKTILRVFDLEGREVALIRQGDDSSGLHHANWDTRNFRPGIYFLRLDTEEDNFTRKIVVLDRAA